MCGLKMRTKECMRTNIYTEKGNWWRESELDTK